MESLELQLGLAEIDQQPNIEADADDLLRQPFMLHRIPVYPVHLVRPL